MIQPHGNKLVNNILDYQDTKKYLSNKKYYPLLTISNERVSDVKNIARGVYSPLEGFLNKKDFSSVLDNMKLSNGIIWRIPIVVDISNEEGKTISGSKEVLLLSATSNEPIAVLRNPKSYSYDKKTFCKKVFGTLDKTHPGVESVYELKDLLVGGGVSLLDIKEDLFAEYHLTPEETRKIFLYRGWRTVTAFQTRNIPHRGHEYLHKQALLKTDGLFIHPVIGKKKLEDFKDEYIISSYEILIDKYLPQGRVVLGILPLEMRYAGPREAVFHALVRKNYGCTHFIVGRDHAGVGDFYEPYAAQEIFDELPQDEIGIKIIKFPEVVFNKDSGEHCFIDECPKEHAVKFSGSAVRTLIKNKNIPPHHLVNPEVHKLISKSKNVLVDNLYKNGKSRKEGFVLWFTGLPQSGKSTIADKVYVTLQSQGINVERLDGDLVRENLTKDLGFSKEDRDENIRRVGFVAKLLAKNRVGVIASFISPYREQRNNLRIKIPNFIEVFVNTPLESCEKWDRKGLYERAKKGEIKNFTGISSPYETPEIPEIELKPDIDGIKKSSEKVVEYLKKRGFH